MFVCVCFQYLSSAPYIGPTSVASLVGAGGIAGHGGAGHRSSVVGGRGGAGIGPFRMASRGAGSGVGASSQHSETEAVRASAVVVGTSRSSLRVSGVRMCSLACVCFSSVL